MMNLNVANVALKAMKNVKNPLYINFDLNFNQIGHVQLHVLLVT